MEENNERRPINHSIPGRSGVCRFGVTATAATVGPETGCAGDGVVPAGYRPLQPGHFRGGVLVAWGNKDAQTFSILVGAIVSLVSSVAGYYFGSSAGSQKKDDVIHAALMTAQGTPPRRQEADRPAGDTTTSCR